MWARLQRLVQSFVLLAASFVLAQPVRADAPAEPPPVRFETHGSFVRLTFLWQRLVDYEVARRGNALTISFAGTAPVEGAAALPRSDLILALSARREGDDTTVVLALAPGTRVRYFRKGLDIIVDVLPPPPGRTRRPAGRALATSADLPAAPLR